MNVRVQILSLLAVVPLAFGGCADKSTEERCEELESYLNARALVDTTCNMDTDCHVIYVRPDQPIPGRAQPDDLELNAALRSYRSAGCGTMIPFTGSVMAVCEARVFDLDIPDAEGDVAEGVLPERYCTLRGDVPESDVGFDISFDAEETACTCGEETPCTGDQICACECIATSPCAEACGHVFACGEMQSLGLGRSAEACVASCEAQLDARPEIVSCVAGRVCGDFEACLR